MNTTIAGAAALSGVRVLDLTQFESGTSCTEALAWMGADVVKVEEPTKGERGRRSAADLPGVDGWYFIILNANKRSVTLDLRSQQGKLVLERMVRQADVMVENFAPGGIERMGFSYERCSALNPRLIYAQIKGFGADGPYGTFPAYDAIAQAAGGSASITGEPDGRPLRAGASVGDIGTGLYSVIGILAAYIQRQVTGRGQRIEVAMQDVVINFCRNSYTRQLTKGMSHQPAVRGGPRSVVHGTNSPFDAYPCSGGGPNDYCYLFSTRQWGQICEVMGRKDLLDDPELATQEGRDRNMARVDAAISEWTRAHSKAEVMRLMGQAGVPAGAVFDTVELAADAYLHRRGTFTVVQHEQRGEFVMPGWPVHMSDTSVRVVAAPLLGQHTAEVYREWLGMEEGELDRLRAAHVV